MRDWFDQVAEDELFLSVLVVGELRQGIERRRRHDPVAARQLERWVTTLLEAYSDRILPVDQRVAELWGQINVPDPLPTVDGLLAATALAHNLTVVTRNARDFARSGATVLNPFSRTH